VDVAILEVGLGGRLDAVNVFDADCSVVTSIDIDHVDYLGDTREQIAFEKAGIFRKGRVAICADSDVPQTLRKHAQEIGADLWCIGADFGFTRHDGQWDYRSDVCSRSALAYPALRGAFQLNNASAVLAALDALREKLPVTMGVVRRGLVEVELAGRFQFIPGKPQLILDVAHNPHAARSLAQNLANLPPAKTFAVFSMLKDKDIGSVVRALDAQVDVWLVAGIDAPRGATTDELVQVLQNAGVRGEVKPCVSLADAVNEASNRAGENDRIAAFGSFYTVAEVMRVRGLRGG
jgi:dihydrofolate synthase/folylpolyglutamate synthase